jgi:uncharacterized membrane protein
MDWFDVALHGTPWLLLIRAVVVTLRDRQRKAAVGAPGGSAAGKS